MDIFFQQFLELVRMGIGHTHHNTAYSAIDWVRIKALAIRQELSPIVLDGIERLPKEQRPDKAFLLHWIGNALQSESANAVQQNMAEKLALLFHQNNIRTYVLKGEVVAECYPNPSHRKSVDMDCFLLPDNGAIDAWKAGNDLVSSKGYEVKYDYYKNSTFILPGLTVENHRYFTPFRGNNRLERLERMLQSMMDNDKGEDRFDGTWLYRPPVKVTALFLIEHAYSHFLHEGLTWRHILDWVLFCRKHEAEIDWDTMDVLIDENGFRKFYDSVWKLGRFLLGELGEEELSAKDKRMLEDVWADLDLHETIHGLQGKLALAGNTWRARWKYRDFADISMAHALWIQVKGYLFQKEPKLK